MSEEYLEQYDRKRQEADPNRSPGRNVNRRRQLDRYNEYKKELARIMAENGYQMPHGYFAVWFYVPIPPSWRRQRVAEMLYTGHQSTPDCDNLIKALLDGVMPRKKRARGELGSDDRKVHCYSAFKVWVRPEEACIKILEYDPVEYMQNFVHGYPDQSISSTG